MGHHRRTKRDVTTRSTDTGEAGVEAAPRVTVTAAFLECNTFLKKFLSGFLRVRQDIEDVAQEAYLRAYVAEQRESIEQPKSFLFQVAKNLARTRLSKKSRQITDYIEDAGEAVLIDTAAGIDEELEAQECLGLYCEAVATLSEKCRQVFLLRKVHGLTHQEIGERMNLSVSSVEKYLRQGILACETYLRDRETPMMESTAQARRDRGKGQS